MGKALGSIIGGAAGFLVGGPAGAAIGAGIGGGVDASRAADQQAAAAQQAAGSYAASSDRAAQLQQQSADRQIALQREMFNRQIALQEPYRKAGEQALNRLIPLSTEYTPFGQQQFQQDPGYAFRLSEGMKALNQQAAARGGLMSGNALRAAQQYGQGLASQEYQNAFDRYQTERAARLKPLQSLAGIGQTSADTLGSAAQQYGTNVGNIYGTTASNIGNLGMGSAAAQGNALLAGAQARGSAYQGIGQSFGNILGQPGVQNYLGGLMNQYAPTFGYSGR